MPQIIGLAIPGCRPAVSWRQVVKELYSGAASRPQAADPQARPCDIVQMFLLCAVIHAFADELESEQIAIEL